MVFFALVQYFKNLDLITSIYDSTSSRKDNSQGEIFKID